MIGGASGNDSGRVVGLVEPNEGMGAAAGEQGACEQGGEPGEERGQTGEQSEVECRRKGWRFNELVVGRGW